MSNSSVTQKGMFRDITMSEIEKHVEADTWGSESAKLDYELPFNPSIPGLAHASERLTRVPTVIPPDQLGRIGTVYTAASPQSHVGPYSTAIDFLVPDGTEVLSAFGGVVIEVQQNSALWGDGEGYRDYLNYVTIKHSEEEFTQYCHLAQNSVAMYGLRIGSVVGAGQPIAQVGKTGWTDRDHLHFIVFRLAPKTRENPFGFMGLRVGFR